MKAAPPTDNAPERRDLATRAQRDRLAELLDVPPGQLRHMSRETAEAMIEMIVRKPVAASDPNPN